MENLKLEEQNTSLKKYEKYYNKLRARKYRNNGCQVYQMELAPTASNFTSENNYQLECKSYLTGESYIKKLPKDFKAQKIVERTPTVHNNTL